MSGKVNRENYKVCEKGRTSDSSLPDILHSGDENGLTFGDDDGVFKLGGGTAVGCFERPAIFFGIDVVGTSRDERFNGDDHALGQFILEAAVVEAGDARGFVQFA